MRIDFVIDTICQIKGIDRDSFLGSGRNTMVRRTRHMTYLILKEKCGVSSYKMARLFHRTRRNVLRAMSNMRYHISIYDEVKKEYTDLISKIESVDTSALSIDGEDEKD